MEIFQMDRCSIYVDTFNENLDNLLRLLKLIDYSKGYDFLSVRPALRPIVREALSSISVEIVTDEPTLLCYMRKEEALKIKVHPPDGIQLRQITKDSDIEKVNAVWPERNENSFQFLKRMIMNNICIGVFREEDGRLLSWNLRLPTGLLGVLQTDQEFYGRGYATLVKKAIARKVAESGDDIYYDIFANNTAARNLANKLGFKIIGEVYWIATKITWTTDDE
ncbi:uncharacterized protein LOC129571539 isoform X2 [Sitodiplosis mosellana]|uniref:uncharacterized protein LOC129571539 isoform X2 n=1 Tax=Sitodiplosis mosellana TaxID=263140 RepID=UPI0024448614|nr:uncharacterized protein LOC129571539 isoform X2 [Sitodiplosis mosellana]